MSKKAPKSPKGFSPARKQPSELPKNAESNIRVKKVSSDALSKEAQEGKLVGGASGPGYNFTGVAPGSE